MTHSAENFAAGGDPRRRIPVTSIDALIDAYDVWHACEPSAGHDREAEIAAAK